MNTSSTTHPAHPLGHWLATLAVSLVLLALAYAHAPDPAGYLGLKAASARPFAESHLGPVPRGHRRAPGQAPVLAAAQVGQPTGMAPRPRLAR